MKKWILAALVLGSWLGIGQMTASRAVAQATTDKLNSKELKASLEGLGYEVKTLVNTPGSEKYEISMKTEKLNIPVGFELSGSGRYLWMTVFLGPYKDSINAKTLLEQNAIIQPSQFYITSKGNLMAGLTVENRAASPATLRFSLEKIVADVERTQKFWTAPANN